MTTRDAQELVDALRRDPRAWTWCDLTKRWSRAAVNSALRDGGIDRVLPGIYASTIHSESFSVRAHAAHLWCGGDSVITGVAAAAVWDLTDIPDTITIACRSAWAKRSVPPWLSVRRSSVRPQSTFAGVCPVASPAWAAVTAYSEMPARSRDSVLYRASQRRDVNADDLRRVADEVPRLRGRSYLRSVIDAIEAGSESHLETRAHREVFNTQAFSDLRPQHRVKTPGGAYRLDMFHAASMTAVELDGRDHEKPTKRQQDINRDANVASVGILTLRFSDQDVRLRKAWIRDVTERTIALRS